MNNTTNYTTDLGKELEEYTKRELSIYHVVFLVFLLAPITVFHALIFLATIFERTINRAILLVLSNISLGSLVTAVGLIMIHLYNIILTAREDLPPSDPACRVMIVFLTAGGAIRLSFMAIYAVTVYLVVKRGPSQKKTLVILLVAIILWIITISYNCSFFSENVLAITFIGGVSCGAHRAGPITTGIISIYLLMYGVIPYVLTILFPIITLYFIKKNTITENADAKKGLAKFALFLILGNSLSLIGQALPIVFATFLSKGDNNTAEKAILFTESAILTVSLIPPVILILIYLKPIRRQIKKMLCITKLEKKLSVNFNTTTGSTGTKHLSSSANATN